MDLAECGRKELSRGGHGMLGLLTCREEFGPVQLFRELNINVSWHMTMHAPGILVERRAEAYVTGVDGGQSFKGV